MTQMKWSFADHKNQPPALFEAYVGCPEKQIFAQSRRNRRHRVDGAGGDHHTLGEETAACQARADILNRVAMVSQRPEIRRLFAQLEEGRPLGGSSENEVCLRTGTFAETLKQAEAVD
jgi:hypothetical protein